MPDSPIDPTEPLNLRLARALAVAERELDATRSRLDEAERQVRELENRLFMGIDRDLTIRDTLTELLEQADARMRRDMAVVGALDTVRQAVRGGDLDAAGAGVDAIERLLSGEDVEEGADADEGTTPPRGQQERP